MDDVIATLQAPQVFQQFWRELTTQVDMSFRSKGRNYLHQTRVFGSSKDVLQYIVMEGEEDWHQCVMRHLTEHPQWATRIHDLTTTINTASSSSSATAGGDDSDDDDDDDEGGNIKSEFFDPYSLPSW